MKNKIKIISLLLFTMILTGCDATYNVKIKNESISEDLTINHNFTQEQREAYSKNPIPVDLNYSSFLDYDSDGSDTTTKKIEGLNYYNIAFKNNNEMNVTSTMDLEKYDNSRIAHSLFNNVNVNNYSDMFSIYGYNGLSAFTSYPDLQKVTVKITVDKPVLDQDADEVKGKTYIWHFDRNTDDNKTLYLEMSKKEIEKTKKTGISVYIILGIFAVSIIGILIMKIYNSKK